MTDVPSAQPIEAVRALAEELTGVVVVAKTLIESGRQIDLTGLNEQVGLLCAASLDLPPDEGRRIRPRLIALSGSLKTLSLALQKAAPCLSAQRPS
jgi:hypothetical protein